MSHHSQFLMNAAVQWRSAPRPAHGETLSSWIERVGAFYGIEYETWVSGVLMKTGDVPKPRQHDLDADEGMRVILSEITVLSLPQIPPTLPFDSANVLPLHERSSFCSLCWDDDIARGAQPYVRRSWRFWNQVFCPTHYVFLSARRRIGQRVSRGTWDWMPLWRSRKRWARAFDSQCDQSLRNSALWYSPARLKTLTPALIARLAEEADRFGACEPASQEHAHREAHRRALQAMALTMTPESRQVSDDIRHDLFGFPADSLTMKGNFDSARYIGVSARPYSLENRMAFLVTAIEVLRRMEARPCISPIIERIIERSCCMRRMVNKNFSADYLLAWPTAERQAFLASWWNRRAVSLKDRETLAKSPRRHGTRGMSSDGSVSRIMRANHATH